MTFCNKKIGALTGLVICMMVLVSCKHKQQQEPPHSFFVITVSKKTVEIKESYSASIRGRQDIEIYPQVSGTISRLCVHEGQKVRKGEVLFIINRVAYEAGLRTAVANVKAAEAQVRTARLEYAAKQDLFKANVVSEYELKAARNALSVARAGVEQARAQKMDARNSLSYTEVKSPSNGTIGTLPYRVGSLVGPSMTQPLTTVSDNAQMYVYFSMTENQLRNLVKQYGSPENAIRQMPSIGLQLNDGTIYEARGRVETISGVINRQTGTVSIRSMFPNKKRMLWSGGIGNVIIAYKEKDVVAIPQSATYELQDKIFAYKVINSKVVSTPIVVDKLNDGNDYVVRGGLKPGDVIVGEGVGLLEDGMDIKIKK